MQLDRKSFNHLHKTVLKALNHLQKRGEIDQQGRYLLRHQHGGPA